MWRSPNPISTNSLNTAASESRRNQSSYVITLQGWERTGEFDHSNLAIKLVEKHRPDCLGGSDVPAHDQAKAITLNKSYPLCHSQLVLGLDRRYCLLCLAWLGRLTRSAKPRLSAVYDSSWLESLSCDLNHSVLSKAMTA